MGGNADFQRESEHVGATVSVLCDIHTTFCAVSKLHLFSILTLLVVLQTILGQCQRAGMLRTSIEISKLRCSPFWVFVSTMRAHSQHCFRRQCRWCRCKHLGLSKPLITIEVFQNLDFTQPSFSRSTHSVCVTRVPAADDRGEFSSSCRPFFTSLGSSRIVKTFVCPKSKFQGLVSTPCSPCSTDTSLRSPLA